MPKSATAKVDIDRMVCELLEREAPAKFDFPFKPSIAIDLDETLIEYEKGNFDKGIFGEPKPGAVEFTQRLREAGLDVGIHTCRGDVEAIKNYLDEHGFAYDWINDNPANEPDKNSHKPVAIAYVDDRAVVADGNFDRMFHEVMSYATKKQ
jgi:hypothetical protein